MWWQVQILLLQIQLLQIQLLQRQLLHYVLGEQLAAGSEACWPHMARECM